MERIASAAISAVYEAAAGGDCWTALYEELRRSVRIDYADFVVGSRSVERAPTNTNDVVRFRHGWFEVKERTAFEDRDGMLERYMDSFSMLDPLSVSLDEQLSRFVELPNIGPDGTVGRPQSGNDWTGTTYYNDFLKPHGIEYPARFLTSISPDEQLVANVNWGVPYQEVTNEERRLVNLGVTHAARILDIERRSGPVLGGVETLLRTLDMVDEAAFVLDGNLQVQTLNRAARDLLEVDIAVSIHRGALRFADATAEETVRHRIEQSCSVPGHCDLAIGGVLGPRALRAQLSMVDNGGGCHTPGAPTFYLLLIDARNAARVGRLLARAVLTLRERQAMIALSALGSEMDAANALGISINTLRTHRRTSYSKLGIASRPELLRLLSL